MSDRESVYSSNNVLTRQRTNAPIDLRKLAVRGVLQNALLQVKKICNGHVVFCIKPTERERERERDYMLQPANKSDHIMKKTKVIF